MLALENVIGPDASQIKRGEHCFNQPSQLNALSTGAGFVAADVRTVEQTIEFPSVLDYVRFQLLATPMAALIRDCSEHERQTIIASIENRTKAHSSHAMLKDGRRVLRRWLVAKRLLSRRRLVDTLPWPGPSNGAR